METLLSGLRAAGESTRLRLLFLLGQGELTVKELTRILGQSQPRISRHLKLLFEAGLVDRHREGSWVFFRRAHAGPTGALARTICELVPADDGAVMRDLERLEDVRRTRAAAAQAYFEAHAAEWDRLRSLHVDEAEVESALRADFGKDKVELLFDLGTGTGRMLELFADRCREGIGIDLNREMLRLARANLERAGARHCHVRQGDIFNLPYGNAVADAVILHQVLHYLEEPALALREAARILRPEGRLLIADFAPHELEFLREEHAHRRLGIADAQMRQWCTQARLRLDGHRELPPGPRRSDNALTVSIWLARPVAAPRAARTRKAAVEEIG